jgi:hypothetical protein
MTDITKEIRARLDAFASELDDLVRQAALEAVQKALGVSAVTTNAAPRKRAPAVKKAAAPAPRGRPAKKAASSRAPGQKRDPEELEKMVERLAAHIKAHPGQRIEQINKVLGVPTKDLALPIKKLLASKRISSKGVKRSTTYFP